MGNERQDLLIVGAGPAGMTAAVFAARKRMQTVVISKDLGGQVNWTTLVENYMGFEKIQGPELVRRFEEQMRGEHLAYHEDEVVAFAREEEDFLLSAKRTGTHRGKAVIFATGKRPRRLGLPGEEELQGRGVSYCSTCDAPLFQGERVAVVGGGNSGAQAVLDLLAVNAAEIHLITDEELTADPVLAEQIQTRARADSRLQLHLFSGVTRLETGRPGDRILTGIEIQNRQSGEKKALPVAGLFVEIGLEPNTEFIRDLEKNDRGELVIDCHCRTAVPGVFAAGDVTIIPEKQIIIAAGEGAKAAIKAWEYLVGKRLPARANACTCIIQKAQP